MEGFFIFGNESRLFEKERPTLSPHNVDIVTTRLSLRESLPHFLSPDELSRAERFKSGVLRDKWSSSRTFLRSVLAGYLGVPGYEIEFDSTCVHCGKQHGKPTIKRPKTSLKFSLSHSDDLLTIAVGTRLRIGVDCEKRRDLIGLDVRRYFMNLAEEAKFEVMSREDQAHQFFRIWTRKEAIAKALEMGLVFPLRSIEEMNLDADSSVSTLKDAWVVHDVTGIQGYSVSVAYEVPSSVTGLRLFHYHAADSSGGTELRDLSSSDSNLETLHSGRSSTASTWRPSLHGPFIYRVCSM